MISVCIATYNGEKYIHQQLESILKQIDVDDEVIISDDMSTDQTLVIIKAFKDTRVRIYEGKRFGSPIRNFENAINYANGNYIFLSDQDDLWLDGKVEKMLMALKDHDVVVSNAFMGDGSLNVIMDSYFDWRNSKTGILKNFIRNSYLGCCMAFNRKILKRILPFPKNIPMHDMWIGMVAEVYFRPIFIQDKLIIYRRHGGNVTHLRKDFKSDESLLSQISIRLNLFLALIKRSIM